MLVHYGALRIGKLRSFSQVMTTEEERKIGRMKPRGLWLSVRGQYDWVWWSEGEQFRLYNFRYGTRIILKPDANVLHLKTGEELDEFTAEYGYNPTFPSKDDPNVLHSMHSTYIDWPRVAEKYQGLIIAPYQWSRRMEAHCFWYYGWDCASAVIWDHTAISQRMPIPRDQMEKHHRPRWRKERYRLTKRQRKAQEAAYGGLLRKVKQRRLGR